MTCLEADPKSRSTLGFENLHHRVTTLPQINMEAHRGPHLPEGLGASELCRWFFSAGTSTPPFQEKFVLAEAVDTSCSSPLTTLLMMIGSFRSVFSQILQVDQLQFLCFTPQEYRNLNLRFSCLDPPGHLACGFGAKGESRFLIRSVLFIQATLC